MLSLSEQFHIDREVLKGFEDNRLFRVAHPKAPMPPAVMLIDAQGHWNYDMYWRSGRKMARRIAGWMREFRGDQPLRYLEWGCGPVRILRHMPSMAGAHHRFTGTDYNPATVDWCRRNFDAMTFEINDLQPPLPFADHAFDFVFSRSVLTHLTIGNGLAWLRELKRVLTPGGILCFSTCGDFYLRKLGSPDERARYLSGLPVESARDHEGRRLFSIKHPPSWVRDHFLEGLEFLRFIPGEVTQDIWLARTPLAEAELVPTGEGPRRLPDA